MYVCVCKGVTDGQIREAVSEGACSMRELQMRLGVSATCGKCAPCAKEVLTQSIAESQTARSYPAVIPGKGLAA